MVPPSSLGSPNPPRREQIDDDVIRLSIPFQSGFVNSYLVLGADGPRLIDTGPKTSAESSQLLAHLDELGVRVADVRSILITHSHHDHVGMAAEIAAKSGASVLIHHLEMAGGTAYAVSQPPRDWLVNYGLPPDVPFVPIPTSAVPRNVELLKGDESINFGPLRLELHWTPGHSPGHLCALEQKRGLLFSGDHLLRTATPLAVRRHSDADPVSQYLDSLASLSSLRPTRVLPGHGRSFIEFEEAVESARTAQLECLESVCAAVPEGGELPLGIAMRLSWLRAKEPARTWLTIARVVAYLQHLETLGRLTHQPGPPVMYFPARF